VLFFSLFGYLNSVIDMTLKSPGSFIIRRVSEVTWILNMVHCATWYLISFAVTFVLQE
jgi:hypothetical protein